MDGKLAFQQTPNRRVAPGSPKNRHTYDLLMKNTHALQPFIPILKDWVHKRRRRRNFPYLHKFRIIWTSIKVVLVIYYMVVVPYVFCFTPIFDSRKNLLAAEILIDTFFWIDIALRALTFSEWDLENDVFIYRPLEIWSRYRNTRSFKWNVIAILPIDLLALVISSNYELYYGLRHIKLLHGPNIMEDIERYEWYRRLNPVLKRLCIILGILYAGNHTVACFWNRIHPNFYTVSSFLKVSSFLLTP